MIARTGGRFARLARPLARPLGVAAVLMLSAVSLLRAQSPAASPVSLKVRNGPYMGYAVLRLAKEQGLFAAQGLDVTLVEVDQNSSIPGLVRGDLDVLPASLTPATLNAIARGARVRVVAAHAEYTAGGCPQSGIMASPALIASGRLERAEGLKGLRVGGTRSVITNFVFDKYLTRFGLSAEDFGRIDLPEEAEGAALKSGRLDVATMGEPALTHALAAGDGVVWKALNDLAPGLQYGFVLFGPRLLDREPEVGERFMRAYVEANRRFAQGKTPSNLHIVSLATGLPTDLAARICWPTTRLDASVNEAPLVEFQAWALAHGLVDRALPFSQIVDRRFTDAVTRGARPGTTP